MRKSRRQRAQEYLDRKRQEKLERIERFAGLIGLVAFFAFASWLAGCGSTGQNIWTMEGEAFYAAVQGDKCYEQMEGVPSPIAAPAVKWVEVGEVCSKHAMACTDGRTIKLVEGKVERREVFGTIMHEYLHVLLKKGRPDMVWDEETREHHAWMMKAKRAGGECAALKISDKDPGAEDAYPIH